MPLGLMALAALLAGAVHAAAGAPFCTGAYEQGAVLACRAAPSSTITLSDGHGFTQSLHADAAGRFVLGFSRDAAPAMTLTVCPAQGNCAQHSLRIARHAYKIERIDGLPPGQVSTFTDAQLAHIRQSSARKKSAFATQVSDDGYLAGFARPVTGARISGVYGAQRVLNGKPKRPHMGLDFAVPAGTPIHAPAAGVVTLADPDLYFEGGTVFLDHGQGLVSVFMHMSTIAVHDGEHVARGAVLGRVGATGRATGPHLHWSLKWRNRYYVNPQSALALDPSLWR